MKDYLPIPLAVDDVLPWHLPTGPSSSGSNILTLGSKGVLTLKSTRLNRHSHASDDHGCFYMDFPLIQCLYERLTDPKAMIAAQWIRSADLTNYEELGYDTFKLLERNIPPDKIVKRVDAYHPRRFDRNLAKLIFSRVFRKRAKGFPSLHFVKTSRSWHTPSKFRGATVGFLHSQGMFFLKLPDNRTPIETQNKVLLAEVLPQYERVQADLIDENFLTGRPQ
ncbi:MAG: hypothetical protein HKM05_01980 [Spirochaetales bacterium]|nr:hypothetical protein [Spirochaetales bacterium]